MTLRIFVITPSSYTPRPSCFCLFCVHNSYCFRPAPLGVLFVLFSHQIGYAVLLQYAYYATPVGLLQRRRRWQRALKFAAGGTGGDFSFIIFFSYFSPFYLWLLFYFNAWKLEECSLKLVKPGWAQFKCLKCAPFSLSQAELQQQTHLALMCANNMNPKIYPQPQNMLSFWTEEMCTVSFCITQQVQQRQMEAKLKQGGEYDLVHRPQIDGRKLTRTQFLN